MASMKIILAAAFVIFLAACGSLEKKAVLLNLGDTKEQVLAVMGPPDDRQLKGENEAWQYCLGRFGCEGLSSLSDDLFPSSSTNRTSKPTPTIPEKVPTVPIKKVSAINSSDPITKTILINSFNHSLLYAVSDRHSPNMSDRIRVQFPHKKRGKGKPIFPVQAMRQDDWNVSFHR
jgi:hypothetical protein